MPTTSLCIQETLYKTGMWHTSMSKEHDQLSQRICMYMAILSTMSVARPFKYTRMPYTGV